MGSVGGMAFFAPLALLFSHPAKRLGFTGKCDGAQPAKQRAIGGFAGEAAHNEGI